MYKLWKLTSHERIFRDPSWNPCPGPPLRPAVDKRTIGNVCDLAPPAKALAQLSWSRRSRSNTAPHPQSFDDLEQVSDCPGLACSDDLPVPRARSRQIPTAYRDSKQILSGFFHACRGRKWQRLQRHVEATPMVVRSGSGTSESRPYRQFSDRYSNLHNSQDLSKADSGEQSRDRSVRILVGKL